MHMAAGMAADYLFWREPSLNETITFFYLFCTTRLLLPKRAGARDLQTWDHSVDVAGISGILNSKPLDGSAWRETISIQHISHYGTSPPPFLFHSLTFLLSSLSRSLW